MIKITWHLFLLVLLACLSLCYALTRTGDSMFGSIKALTTFLWVVVWLVILLIYGGIFWW